MKPQQPAPKPLSRVAAEKCADFVARRPDRPLLTPHHFIKYQVGVAAELEPLIASVYAEQEKRIGALLRAISTGMTRYSQDHGLPNPMPKFAFEHAFSMSMWQEVEKAAAAIKELEGL